LPPGKKLPVPTGWEVRRGFRVRLDVVAKRKIPVILHVILTFYGCGAQTGKTKKNSCNVLNVTGKTRCGRILFELIWRNNLLHLEWMRISKKVCAEGKVYSGSKTILLNT